VSWDDLIPALEAVSRELSLEVQRTFDYFASTADSERIGKIVLSGGCAKLSGIEEFLASSWGVPVEVAQPLAAIERDPARFSDEDMREAECLLAVAVGLGLRRPGDKPA
jgi:type IV pilus assembly protein PilM